MSSFVFIYERLKVLRISTWGITKLIRFLGQQITASSTASAG